MGKIEYLRNALKTHPIAQMAELVDALVSNTSNSNVVPVRPRLWVLQSKNKDLRIKPLGLYYFRQLLFKGSLHVVNQNQPFLTSQILYHVCKLKKIII